MEPHITQYPEPGKALLLFAGDTITFTLEVAPELGGTAFLRTNLDQTSVTRKEIIREVEQGEHPLGHDWFDIPMKSQGRGKFTLTLPVCDPGHFQCKCYFLKPGKKLPLWPEGKNTILNVEPAHACCDNTLYNAFVRQFGPNKAGNGNLPEEKMEWIRSLDQQGYSIIPPSGTFRDLIGELDFIIHELGCKIIQLLPIHPTPTTYAKMGRFGSPYAALSFTGVDPALAQFDPKATPMEQFMELVDAIHARSAKIYLDIAINHTGWAARLHETHPEWLARTPEGEIIRPGAWGVVWGDLTKLDFRHKRLWQYMAGVFLKWCRRGVDGFRCDAGYMIPVEAWKYILAKVREQFPDTMFLLEGLGGSVDQTRDILNTANFDMAYSELFQNFDRNQIEHYLPGAFDLAQSMGLMLHFAETHDNLRLAATSRVYAKMRTALCALFSQNGAFAFANGVEWLATEKIDVHKACSLNWGNPVNQVENIRRLTGILKNHPAFSSKTQIRMIQKGPGEFLALLRHHAPTGKKLLVLANLDWSNPQDAQWAADDWNPNGDALNDLLSDAKVRVNFNQGLLSVPMAPGQVMCLSENPQDLKALQDRPAPESPASASQRLRAKALTTYRHFEGTCDLEEVSPEDLAKSLSQNPRAFVQNLAAEGKFNGMIPWHWPRDKKREVMIPPGHFLAVFSKHPFSARIQKRSKVLASESCFEITNSRGGARVSLEEKYCCLFLPKQIPDSINESFLHMFVYENGLCKRAKAPIVYLPSPDSVQVSRVYSHKEIQKHSPMLLGTNGRGAMLRAHARWGEVESRYDALLAANLHHQVPVDRWIMLTRCRMWVIYQGHSREINATCLDSFRADADSRGFWRFSVPSGQGQHIVLNLGLEMIPEKNLIAMDIFRCGDTEQKDRLPNGQTVQVVIRPDLEDRSFHDTTKAFTGPEKHFPEDITPFPDGFDFKPHPDRVLSLRIDQGRYIQEPEWRYMVHRPLEAQRGLDAESDLFSPGFFSLKLRGGDSARLVCGVNENMQEAAAISSGLEKEMRKPDLFESVYDNVREMAKQAMDHYVVKRDQEKTVIAGYPWFLDWGRDSLIFLRGLIATGRLEESKAILKQFAKFEEQGTIPNMIRGKDAGNRDTSDAPLWFFVACKELMEATGRRDFLEEDCGGRPLRKVLISLIENISEGTPNGVKMDPQSGLVFSPSHYTWMDTNHPPGTPRQGYPVEIQALWHAALDFSRIISPQYGLLADRVKMSLASLFFKPELGYLADCLHCEKGQLAKDASVDDALRPNQLFAITLGAISDQAMCEAVVGSAQELLVPGAIRSLADRPVSEPLFIRDRGDSLNDPFNPYFGIYQGDEDTRRKPAYHNGTAWTWVFPSFCEAWAMTFGAHSTSTALAWLLSSARLLRHGACGHLPEILDGDAPHTHRGCDCQAWGVSEFYRVYKKLTATGNP